MLSFLPSLARSPLKRPSAGWHMFPPRFSRHSPLCTYVSLCVFPVKSPCFMSNSQFCFPMFWSEIISKSSSNGINGYKWHFHGIFSIFLGMFPPFDPRFFTAPGTSACSASPAGSWWSRRAPAGRGNGGPRRGQGGPGRVRNFSRFRMPWEDMKNRGLIVVNSGLMMG